MTGRHERTPHAAVSKLTAYLSGVAAIEAMFFSTLAPLLPSFEHDFHLSKAQVGLLVAMYAIGWVVAVLPVGLLASRVGVKRFALVGLVALGASSIGFGVVGDYPLLLATRLLQGIAAALCFAAALAWLIELTPRDRRGETISIYGGAAAAGTIAGPLVGGAAVLLGRGAAFGGVAGLTFALAAIGLRFPGPPPGAQQPFVLVRAAHRSREVLGTQWLVTLPGLLIGTIFALAPLQLNRAGWHSTRIAATFLTAAALGVVARPFVGRWADRRGLERAVLLIVLASLPLTLAIPWLGNPWLLAPCIAVTVTTYGLLWGPTMALVSHAYEDERVTQLLGFALMGLTSGIGLFVGSGVGGAIADVAGDGTVYVLLAVVSLATAAATARVRVTRRRSSEPAARASLRTR